MLIGFDPACKNGDHTCMYGFRIDKKGTIHIENIKYFPKEEKKVKVNKMSREKFKKLPYLDVKVVPVEQKEKQEYLTTAKIGGKLYGFLYYQGELVMEQIKKKVKKPKKGNWINGENLDKIKFPCFCSYVSHTGEKRYAQLNKVNNGSKEKYKLSRIFQDNGENIFLSCDILKKFIRKWDIHILKGKIILFEEE